MGYLIFLAVWFVGGMFMLAIVEGKERARFFRGEEMIWDGNTAPPPIVLAAVWPITLLVWLFIMAYKVPTTIGIKVAEKLHKRRPKKQLPAKLIEGDYRTPPRCSNCGAVFVDEEDES